MEYSTSRVENLQKNVLDESLYAEKNEPKIDHLKKVFKDQHKMFDEILETIKSTAPTDEQVKDLFLTVSAVSQNIRKHDSPAKLNASWGRQVDVKQIHHYTLHSMDKYFRDIRAFLKGQEEALDDTIVCLGQLEQFENLLHKSTGLTQDEVNLLPERLLSIIFPPNRRSGSKEQLLSYAEAKGMKCQRASRREDKNVVLERTAEDIDGYEGQKSVEELVKVSFILQYRLGS